MQNRAARFCTHLSDFARRKQDFALCLFKSRSTFGQQIESATQPKCADSICKLQVFCMFLLTYVYPPLPHQFLKQGTECILEAMPETWRAIQGEQKTHLPPTLHRLKSNWLCFDQNKNISTNRGPLRKQISHRGGFLAYFLRPKLAPLPSRAPARQMVPISSAHLHMREMSLLLLDKGQFTVRKLGV